LDVQYVLGREYHPIAFTHLNMTLFQQSQSTYSCH
jgi:hypothetical protein